MRVCDWQDVLEDVVESSADAGQWRAVGGDRPSGISEDLYLGHPGAGVFQLKTYAKNPFEAQGVGTQMARRRDDELDPLSPEQGTGTFGVQQPIDAEEISGDLESVLQAHADAPTTVDALFEDVMDAMGELADTFEEAEELLEAEFEDAVEEDIKYGFY